jgi:molybdopterin-biosynthesis enzyme MoeA-like protein
MALLAARYRPSEFNERRQRMARIPKGASLIKNPVSVAPGFQIENVFVLAGVPKIMQAMLEDVAPRLERGVPVRTRSITVALAEGTIAEPLAAIQADHPRVSIGSYPFFAHGGPSPSTGRAVTGTTLVVRGRDEAEVEAAAGEILALAQRFGISPK